MGVYNSGSASFQECSFSGNTAGRNVSSLSLNSLFDLFSLLFLCFCVPPPPPLTTKSSQHSMFF